MSGCRFGAVTDALPVASAHEHSGKLTRPGGPAVTFDELPDHVAQWLTSTGRSPFGDEPILVVDTAVGVAYKTDTLLFGPCAAVDAAYRTFQDPIYNDRCY